MLAASVLSAAAQIPWRPGSARPAGEESPIGIGLGTIVVIVIIVLAVMFLRRHRPAVMHQSLA